MHKNHYDKNHTNFDTIDEVIDVIKKYPVTYKEAKPRYRDEDFGFKIASQEGNIAYLHGTTNFTTSIVKKPFVSMTWDNPAGSRVRGRSGVGVEDLEECLQKLVDGTWDEVEPWEKFANDYYDKVTRAHSRESMKSNKKSLKEYHKNEFSKNFTVFDTLDEVIETIKKYNVTYKKIEPKYKEDDFGYEITNEHGDTAALYGRLKSEDSSQVWLDWEYPGRNQYGMDVEDLEEYLQRLADGTLSKDTEEETRVKHAASKYYKNYIKAHSRESLVKDFSKKFIEDEGGACTSASCGCGTGAQTSGGLQAFAPENAVVAGGRNLFVGGVRREKALNIRNTPTGNVKTGGNIEYKRKKQYRNKAFGESLVQQFVRTHLSEDADGAGDRIILTYTAYANWHNDVLPDGDFLSVFDDGMLWNNSRNATNWANACDAIGSGPGDDELADYIDEKYHPHAAKAVKKITMEFDKNNEQLLVAVKLNTKATDEIIKDVVDYVNGQMSDGWGEGFEQTPVFDAQIYAVYNDYDIDLYVNERDAERALTRLQYEQENDDEDDDHSSDYVMDEVNVELFYSFYKHGVKLPAKVEVQ